MSVFQLSSEYKPTGDQPNAIRELCEGLDRGDQFQTLLGVTGSGKTFSVSNVIQHYSKPTLVISHNKTLAAQLYGEIRSFFPNNAVEFFISYYDYYQPEAYIPSTDTFIEKDLSINDEIDRLRLRATSALVSGREDVIIVASVSCIYGIGSRDQYADQVVDIERGQRIERNKFLRELTNIHYVRNDMDFSRGTFRVRGDVVEIMQAYEDEESIRVEFFGDEIDSITLRDRMTGELRARVNNATVFPAKHFLTSEAELERAIGAIEEEMDERLEYFRSIGKLLEAQRLEQRTRYDIEMMKEIGYCAGIENYSRHLADRKPGERPEVLMNYFPEDFLLIIDESHQTIPQVRAMYNGDRARKETLVEHGFRLPSALDNRPLKFDEFEGLINKCIFVSATPSDYELEQCGGVVVEQIIRPTGLLDPPIEVRPQRNQIDDLIAEIRERTARQERVLVTTLTKRMAEDLTDYLENINIRVRYIHSDIDSLERVEILRELRLGNFDVLVGVNLLREGLDLPEVTLVAILDADKEGFLRSEKSLMQIAGRTARNVGGLVVLYADRMTDSMQKVIDETQRRRELQKEYNEEHNIQPMTIRKSMEEIMNSTTIADVKVKYDQKVAEKQAMKLVAEPVLKYMTNEQKSELLEQLETEMRTAAKDLEFERAAQLRDEIERIKGTVKEGKS
ncbi:MAG: excinuclease ABC subunit B [Ectothiorhodospiraceae bacterium]|nr:excinuclease ABC subunit B [Ectothiorhodospiraceae bacterium]